MRYPVYTELNAFPIGYKVFEYYLNSCVLLIDKQNESCRFSTQQLMVNVAVTASGCHLMSDNHAEKDLKKNKNLNKFTIKCIIKCCFYQNVTKQVNSLILKVVW